MKNESKKLLVKKLHPENIKITLVDEKLIFSNEVKKEIENIWSKKKEEKKRKGLNFYNGKSYRMTNWRYKNNILELDLAIFDYKYRFGATQIIKSDIFDIAEVWHGGCFVGAGVTTSDSKYVMVGLSGKSMNSNSCDLPGGILEEDIDFIGTGEFLFATIKKEMKEEIGVLENDIEKIYLEMMYQGKEAHTGFYFNVTLNVDSDELKKRFKGNEDIDIESILFYEKNEFTEILKNHNKNKKLILKELF